MLASYVRGGTQSIALLARAHDMRYQAVVSEVPHFALSEYTYTLNLHNVYTPLH